MGWLSDYEQQELEKLKQISAADEAIKLAIAALEDAQESGFRHVNEELKRTLAEQKSCCREVNEKLDKILAILAPPPPVAFDVTEQQPSVIAQGENMAAPTKFHATIDFQIQDNGTAKLTASTVPAGSSLPSGVVATWAPNPDGVPPGGLSIVADLNQDPSGLIAIATGVAAEVGAVPTISATLPSGAVITGSGNPIDVTETPTGFVVAEQ